MNSINPAQNFVPSEDVVTSIVIPTIIFCIGMVVAMLIGIHKSKQWELDKIVEIRRTRRVIQRITARLREKNFTTIQKARNLRKRAVANKKKTSVDRSDNSNVIPCAKMLFSDQRQHQQHYYVMQPVDSQTQHVQSRRSLVPPPTYINAAASGFSMSTFSSSTTSSPYVIGYSPPPTYEDSLLDQLYVECMPSEMNTTKNDPDQLDEFGEYANVGSRRTSKAKRRRQSSTSVTSKRSHRK